MDDVTSVVSSPSPDAPAPVSVRYWAGAAEAAGCEHERLSAATVAQLRRQVLETHPAMAGVLARCSVLVEGARADDEHVLQPDAVVEILPPFAGG